MNAINGSDVVNSCIKAKIDYLTGVVNEDLSVDFIDTKGISTVDKRRLENELAFVDLLYKQDMPVEVPSQQLDERFYRMLNQASEAENTVKSEAENTVKSEAENTVKSTVKSEAENTHKSPTILASIFTRIRSLLTQVAPPPVWQAAALVVVFAVGYQSNDDAVNPMQQPTQQLASNAQVEALNQQVSSLNALVAMSMINSDSASKRLAGIEYSAKVATVDNELNQALLQLLRDDSSTSIRLSALNAMANQGRKLGLSGQSQQALLASLAGQPTMVQVNIITVLMELGDKNTLQALRRLAANNGLDDDAKNFLIQAQNQAI